MRDPTYPSLYQINTRVWLTELARNLRRPATLDDVPVSGLDRLADLGFDWVWFLSVWRPGRTALRTALTKPMNGGMLGEERFRLGHDSFDGGLTLLGVRICF